MTMSDFNRLTDKIDDLQRQMDERYDQQVKFNEGVLANLDGIRETMSDIKVFQSELNHTNSKVDDVANRVDKLVDKVNEIKIINSINTDVTKELRQWKWIIATAVVIALVTAFFAVIIPDKKTEQIEQQTKLLQQLIEQKND